MKRNGKIIVYILLFIYIFAPGISAFFEENDFSLKFNDYARITEVDYKAVVVDEPDSQGKIIVTERLTYDIHAASQNNLFWELWRELPEDEIDGVPVHYKVNSVKQILPDGTKKEWTESDKLYWDDYDYVNENTQYGPEKWYYSKGPYNEYLRQYECLLFYVDGLYREEVVFEIEYEMYNAALRYNDCSDLYISLYSGDTTKYLESFNAEILIPNKDMPKAGNYYVTTYGTKKNSFPVEESATKNPGYYTFSFDFTKKELKFRPYNEFIEFDLVAYGDDKHSFTEYASINDYTSDDVLDYIHEEQSDYKDTIKSSNQKKTILCLICTAISIGIILSGRKKLRDASKKASTRQVKHLGEDHRCELHVSEPQSKLGIKEKYMFRDIPSDLDPNFAATLVFCKDRKGKDDAAVYSALLLSLARKEYVELKEIGTENLLITLTNKEEGPGVFESLDMFDPFDPREPLEPLTASEKYYFDLIKRHASYGSITMNELKKRIAKDYQYMSTFVKNIDESARDCGILLKYFRTYDYKKQVWELLDNAKPFFKYGIIILLSNIITNFTRLDLIYGGLFLLGATCLARWIYFQLVAHRYTLLTPFGEEEYQKWRGLYNFLKSDTLMNERTMIELPLWEKYLVYATAFGISEKVVKAMKIRCPETPSEKTQSIVYNTYCRSGRMHTHGRSFHSSVRTASRYYHSGSSGYGGLSSGGYGGARSSFSGRYGGGGRGGGGGGGGH